MPVSYSPANTDRQLVFDRPCSNPNTGPSTDYVLILLLILGCTDLLCSEIRPDSACGGAPNRILGNFQSAALKAQCHIKCHDTKSLIIQKIIKKLPSSVINHLLNTSYIPSTCLNCRRFSLSLTAKKSYMALLIQLSNRRRLVVDTVIALDSYSTT